MTLRQQITEALKRILDAGVLVEIHEGRAVPPLTDYFLQAIPADWNAPPPEYVDGRMLIPIFKNADCYTIYFIEPDSGRFLAIDPENPWPPTMVFESCRDFKRHIFRVATANKSDDVKKWLREELQLAELDG